MITQKYAKELFDCVGGNLVWKVKKAKAVNIGDKAGTVSKDGYVRVIVDGKSYLAHRIVYLMEHGVMPTEIDHINRIKTDNHISNLRQVTRSQNGVNKGTYKTSSTGVKNVYSSEFGYCVSFQRNKQRNFVGCFQDLELAQLVALEAVDKYNRTQLAGAK